MVPQQQKAPFKDILLACDRLAALNLAKQWQDTMTPTAAIDQLIVPVLEDIGQGWEQGSVALSQVYMASRICEEITTQLLPALSRKNTKQPAMAIALLNDYHSLGKTIVYSTLLASGHTLKDYGRMSTAELVQRVIADKLKIILISTLMLPSALHIAEVSKQLKGHDVHIIVGGAPFRFDPTLWQQVGAHAMGRTASDAITLINEFLGAKS